MSDDPRTTTNVLKCPECNAKVNSSALQSNRPIVCEYCGAIIVPPRQQLPASAPSGRLRGRRFYRQKPGAPLLHTVRLLSDKGAIDGQRLKQYTKRNIDQGMRPPLALRAALRKMHDEGRLKRDKIMKALDELIAEKKLPPRARSAINRLFTKN
jgi:DNA-directed RNA polymerase subunit RPC12/RpoP